jgi:hypothetical protein
MLIVHALTAPGPRPMHSANRWGEGGADRSISASVALEGDLAADDRQKNARLQRVWG